MSGCGIAFYTDYVFTHSPGNFGCNAIVFGADSQENNNVLAIAKGNVKIKNKTVNVKASYANNVSAPGIKMVLSLHYNRQNGHIFSNGIKITDFTVKYSYINNEPICSGNISKNFSVSDTKKTRLYGSVHYFSVDYTATSTNDTVKIHKCLKNQYL